MRSGRAEQVWRTPGLGVGVAWLSCCCSSTLQQLVTVWWWCFRLLVRKQQGLRHLFRKLPVVCAVSRCGRGKAGFGGPQHVLALTQVHLDLDLVLMSPDLQRGIHWIQEGWRGRHDSPPSAALAALLVHLAAAAPLTHLAAAAGMAAGAAVMGPGWRQADAVRLCRRVEICRCVVPVAR